MGRTKGSGGGTIYKYRNGWRGQLTVNGNRVSVSAKTKKEVADKLAELRVEANRGLNVEESNITVEQWINHWIEQRCAPRLAEQSLIRLKSGFDVHIIPAIGGMRLKDLDRATLEQMYATVFQSKSGKKYKTCNYSHSTVNALAVRFKKCLQYAVDEGLLRTNPHNGVELHKLRPPKKISAYSIEDHRKIVEFTKNGKPVYRIFYLLISTGMRFGEAAALTWDDVDFKNNSIRISKTAVSLHGSMVIQDRPKTSSGVRIIYVPKVVGIWLAEIYKLQDQDLNYRNLVMPNMNYNVINSANAIAHWKRACSEMGIEYNGMHALRHTWATRALEQGVDVKVVSSMLGHKNIITTMNIYQDVLADQKIKAADKMASLY